MLATLGMTEAAKIAARARQMPFANPEDLSGMPGLPSNLFRDNQFAITAATPQVLNFQTLPPTSPVAPEAGAAPELNFFSEPRIQLYPARLLAGPSIGNIFAGIGGNLGTALPVLQQYPTPAQLGNFTYAAWAGNTSLTAWGNSTTTNLTRAWPMSFVHFTDPHFPQRLGIPGNVTGSYSGTTNVPLFNADTEEYALGTLIARYLSGRNAANATVSWPGFAGASPDAHLGTKYNARQLDSITLQILDTLRRGAFTDFMGNFTVPTYLPKGWLSGEPVMGLSRGPVLTEVLLVVETSPDSVPGTGGPKFRVNELTLEFYVPQGFGSTPIQGSMMNQFAMGDGIGNIASIDWRQYFNNPEARGRLGPDADAGTAGYQSWWDNMWTVANQFGNSCVDFRGASKGTTTAPLPDPDQAKATTINRPIISSGTHAGKRQAGGQHSAASEGTSLLQVYNADGGVTGNNRGMLNRVMESSANPFAQTWYPGEWKTVTIRKDTNFVDMGAGTLGIKMRGGLSFWINTRRPNNTNDNARWTLLEAVPMDSLGGVPWVDGTDVGTATQSAVVGRLKKAALRFPDHTHVAVTSSPKLLYYHWYVRDPLVNKFPGDWIASFSLNSIPVEWTPGAPPPDWTNPAKADPRALAWLHLDPTGTVRRTQRYPSVGMLSQIRTGIIPDDLSADLTLQKGAPFRTLNLAPSTDPSQTNPKTGVSYPDWAMLDLFTVPALNNFDQNGAGQRLVSFTHAGGTHGRINANARIEPFAGNLTRLEPLQAAFKGLSVNPPLLTNGTLDWSAATWVDHQQIASAIRDYQTSLGRPLVMPAELCNVPAIASYTTTITVNGTTVHPRNDLVTQALGHFTTRSTRYTAFIVAQTLDPETGAFVDEVRRKSVIRAGLDLGTDGVAGNTASPGIDGLVGTPDDPVDPMTHPLLTAPLLDHVTNTPLWSLALPRPTLAPEISAGLPVLEVGNLDPGQMYRITTSPDLGSWSPWTAFTANATTAQFPFTVDPDPRQFFRVEWTIE